MVRERHTQSSRSKSTAFYPLKLSGACAILSKALCFVQHLGMRSNGQATAGKVKRTHAAKVAGAFFVCCRGDDMLVMGARGATGYVLGRGAGSAAANWWEAGGIRNLARRIEFAWYLSGSGIRQYVAPTVQPMTFPGNAVQRDFPGNGVVLPN